MYLPPPFARLSLAVVLALLLATGVPVAPATHGQQPGAGAGQERRIWLAPGPEANLAALFAHPVTWAEARASIHALCVPLAWIGDPARSDARFLANTFLPSLASWNVRLCVDAGRGAWWDTSQGRVVRAEETFQLEQAWWTRLRQVLGSSYGVDYVRVDAPNQSGLLPPPRGAGLTLPDTVRETATYIQLVRQVVPEARVGVVEWLFESAGRWETYVSDVQRWSELLQANLGQPPDFVHFELLTDADPALPRDRWISRAREAAPAQEVLRSKGITVGTAILDRARPLGPDGAPILDDRTWYEDRLLKMLVAPYREAGFVPDALIVGAREPSLPLLPDAGPYTLTALARSLAETFRDDGLPALLLRDAPLLQFPGVRDFDGTRRPADSNSPAHWDDETLYLFNSAHVPWRSSGWDLFNLGTARPVDIDSPAGDASRWLEATFKDDDGMLYGWYHLEPSEVCPQETDRPDTALTAPRIGAMRSRDDGRTWKDLGVVITAPPVLRCDTRNHYYAGGAGDFSVLLDQKREFFYFFFSTFAGEVTQQGVGVARLAYADLEAPVGRVFKWHNGWWGQPGLGGEATMIFPAAIDWHRPDAYAFWGPSIHWNTYLEQYVMVLNRAHDANWTQEGAYVSFNRDLANPRGWTVPKKFRGPGGWYAQLVGTDAARRETDKLIGRTARYFEQGVSRYEVTFLKPEEARGVAIPIP